MTDEPLRRIQDQFRRQADAYERMRIVSDEGGLQGLVLLSRVAADERVVDVACGPGFLTMAFAAAARRAVGVDATDVFLRRARETARARGLHGLDFVLGDVRRLPVAYASFDVASCRAAFHHFPEPETVLREMARVVRPGGRLVIADMLTSEDPAKARLHDEIERLCDPTHARALTEPEFRRMFEAEGLTVGFAGRTRIAYALAEWIEHGGPPPERAREIEARMRASIDGDRTGLEVRVEDGGIRFRHEAAAFLLEKPAG